MTKWVWLLGIIAIIIIIVVVIIYFWRKFPPPDPVPQIDLSKLVNLDELIPCSDVDNQFFVESLGMVVSPTPNVASLVCMSADTDEDFNTCESLIVPNDNVSYARPVAYRNTGNGVELYYGLRAARGC